MDAPLRLQDTYVQVCVQFLLEGENGRMRKFNLSDQGEQLSELRNYGLPRYLDQVPARSTV